MNTKIHKAHNRTLMFQQTPVCMAKCVCVCVCVCIWVFVGVYSCVLTTNKSQKVKKLKRQKQRKNQSSETNWATGTNLGGALGPIMPSKLRLNIFSRHFDQCHLLIIIVLCYHMQLQQIPMLFSHENGKKPYFWPILAPFCPNLEPNNFFSKIGLRHFFPLHRP